MGATRIAGATGDAYYSGLAPNPTGYNGFVRLTVPSGAQAGDLLVAVIMSHNSAPATAPTGAHPAPTGWTSLGTAKIDQAGSYVHSLTAFVLPAWNGTTTYWDFQRPDYPNTGIQRGNLEVYRGATGVSGTVGTTTDQNAGATATSFQVAPATASKAGQLTQTSLGWYSDTSPFVQWVGGQSTPTITQSAANPRNAIVAASTAGSWWPSLLNFYNNSYNMNFPLYAALRIEENTPPNAPTLTSLTGGEVIDRAAVNRASHTFSDPDAGDSQSAFDHRYRLVGAATWTTAYASTPNGFVDYPAGTFAAGDYERQVRTYDSQGVVGAWSGSSFFTAANAPATPTITDPVQNEVIATPTRDVTWSAPSQDAYQLQVLDGGVVVHDSGTVVTAVRTAYGVPFPDNGVSRSIRVRVRSGGLWSSWYTIAVTVSYTPPPVPAVTVQASGSALVVQVTNPTPGAGEPAVTSNEIFVTDPGLAEQRRAVVAANGSWTYWLPASGVDYTPRVRVEAVGSNGTRSSS